LWNFSQFGQRFVWVILIFSKVSLDFQNNSFHIFRRKFHIYPMSNVSGVCIVLHLIFTWSS
jgi:hypothetical protein